MTAVKNAISLKIPYEYVKLFSSQLFIKVVYRPCREPAPGSASSSPTGEAARYYECPDCYFPLRNGNQVGIKHNFPQKINV